MTEREREIINLIKDNPLITQEEMAAKLNCARTSVAVHISNLMKKGVILGKKYIVNEDPYVLTIGATNIDIQGRAVGNVIRYDSNSGNINISFGGVAKNIAENLSKFSINSKFITALGDDTYANDIKEYLKSKNLDISDSLFLKNEKTSMYISILNDEREMEMAISSTDICKHISPAYLETIKKKILGAKLIVLDTNLEEETLKYISHIRNKPKIILDTVSTKKALKVKDFVGKFHTIKPNKMEAEILSGITIYGNEDLKRVGDYFLSKGVEKVYISLGAKGVFYMDKNNNDLYKNPKISPVSTTGAGDAFVSGIIYGEFNDYDIVKSTKYGVAAAVLTSLSDKTVSDRLSARNVETLIEELGL